MLRSEFYHFRPGSASPNYINFYIRFYLADTPQSQNNSIISASKFAADISRTEAGRELGSLTGAHSMHHLFYYKKREAQPMI